MLQPKVLKVILTDLHSLAASCKAKKLIAASQISLEAGAWGVLYQHPFLGPGPLDGTLALLFRTCLFGTHLWALKHQLAVQLGRAEGIMII